MNSVLSYVYICVYVNIMLFIFTESTDSSSIDIHYSMISGILLILIFNFATMFVYHELL